MGLHRDQCLVVEGHPSLPVGVVFVSLLFQDWCWFGLVRPAEGLFQEPNEVCALEVRPRHCLQCGALGGVVGDSGLAEGVDPGGGFRRRWLLGIGGPGGRPFLARAPSGVEEVDDTLSCECIAAPLLGLWQGSCGVSLAHVLSPHEVLFVGGA